MVGTGGQASKLQRLAKRLGLGAAIRFHGFLPAADLERVYVLFPRLREHLPAAVSHFKGQYVVV